jgi:hypothetical protein
MQAGEHSWGTKANIIDSIRSCLTLRVVESYLLHSKVVLSLIDTQFKSAETMNWDTYTSATEGRKLLPDRRKANKTKASNLLDSIQTKFCPFLLFMAVTTLGWCEDILSYRNNSGPCVFCVQVHENGAKMCTVKIFFMGFKIKILNIKFNRSSS